VIPQQLKDLMVVLQQCSKRTYISTVVFGPATRHIEYYDPVSKTSPDDMGVDTVLQACSRG